MILPIKNQVSSLELSKKLKELRVKQFGSHFQWVIDEYPKKGCSYISENGDEIEPGNDRCDAYSVAELGEILPVNEKPIKTYKRKDGKYFIQWKLLQIIADTEADARALCLIYLLENNLITL